MSMYTLYLIINVYFTKMPYIIYIQDKITVASFRATSIFVNKTVIIFNSHGHENFTEGINQSTMILQYHVILIFIRWYLISVIFISLYVMLRA